MNTTNLGNPKDPATFNFSRVSSGPKAVVALGYINGCCFLALNGG